MNRVKVESVDSEGNPKVVYVIKPGTKQLAGAKKAANKAFKDAYESGCYFRQKIDHIMREQGLWDDEQQKELDELNDKVNANVQKLKLGNMDLEEAKKLAIQIKRDRTDSLLKLAKSRELDAFTVESQADNTSFDYLVSVCIVDEEGQPVFSSMEEYLENANVEFASKAASVFGELYYGYDSNWEKKLPENDFLLKYKFCNDDLSLVNEEGKLVSVNGRLIDEKGRYRTSDGGYEDVDGNPMDKDGNYLNFKPFTKNGEPV